MPNSIAPFTISKESSSFLFNTYIEFMVELLIASSKTLNPVIPSPILTPSNFLSSKTENSEPVFFKIPIFVLDKRLAVKLVPYLK